MVNLNRPGQDGSNDSGKRRRSWRTQKYLLSDPIFSQQIIAGIHKSFSEANCILKMGNIWRSFWYAGIIILLQSAGCSLLTPRRHQPKKLATWLKIQNSSQNWSGLVKQEWQWWFSWKQISRPISSEDYFCGSSKEEIKRESIWRPKDRVNSHDRESLKTALPYLQMIINKTLKPLLQPFRWNWLYLFVQLCLSHFHERYCPEMT